MKAICIFLMLFSIIYAESFKAYSENMPPYNYVENGKVSGISTEILKKITKNSSIYISKIEILPWKRAYEQVLSTKNTVLYSAGRSSQRENLFAWVGPIDSIRVGIVAKKDSKLTISKIADFNSYKIGTITSSFVEQKLLKKGINKNALDSFINIESQVKKLVSGRVDMVAFSIPAICYFLQKMGEDLNDYEEVYFVGEADLYFAFNKDSDKDVINELNRNIKSIDNKNLSKSYTLVH
jgi:polar amino acid transport system substrate-binding protein